MIKISKRLTAIANIVLQKESKKIIDVGCDHALLDIYLLQNNMNLKIIASDINEKPLESAKKNIEKYSFLNKIELCQKDGIKGIDKDVDTVVISGMGMETIVEILESGKSELDHVERLIISSNNKYKDLRTNVIKLGYKISFETIIYDEEKYYIMIEFTKGTEKYSEKELYFGPVLLKNKNENFYNYYRNIKNVKEMIKKRLPDDNSKNVLLEKEIELLNDEC